MSTEEKPDTDPQIEIKVVRVPVKDILSGKVSLADAIKNALPPSASPKPLSPIERVAAALSAVHILKETSESNPARAELLLSTAWRSIERKLNGYPEYEWEVQSILFGEYFRHAGNWRQMEDCLIATGEALQTERGEFHTRYEEFLPRARAEYAKIFPA